MFNINLKILQHSKYYKITKNYMKSLLAYIKEEKDM